MLEIKRTTARRTAFPSRDRGTFRRIVITIEPGDLVGFRYERTRQTYRLPVARLMQVAMTVYADAERRRKAEERKAKRSPR